MKRLLVGLLLTILWLSGCQTVSEPVRPQPETATQTETQINRLRFMEKSDPPSQHPWYAADERSFLLLGNVHSGLFNMNSNQEVTNDLVRQTDISQNGLTYTFRLKSASFINHLGEVVAPITAHDFVYAWKKLADPVIDSPHQGLLVTAGIKGARQISQLQDQLDELAQKERQIIEISINDYRDTATASAEDQYRKQLAEFRSERDELAEELIEQHGSLSQARQKVYQLIDQLGVSASNDTTLVVELERPVPFLQEILCFPAFYPIQQAFHQQHGSAYATSAETSLFSGPYYLSTWRDGELFVMDKNPHYWDSQAISLEGMDLTINPDMTDDDMIEAYLNNEIDYTSLTGEKIEKYGNRPDAWYRMDASVVYVEINQAYSGDRRYRKLLADADARKALHMVLDKTKLTDQVLNNGSIASDAFYPRSFQQVNGRDIRLLSPEYADGYNLYDIEQAEQLWEAAKDRAGLSWAVLGLLVADSPNGEKVAAFLKSEWERLLPGITVEIRSESFSDKLKSTERGDFHLSLNAWTPDYPDILSFAELWLSHGGHNVIGFSNPEYDELVHSANTGPLALPGKEDDRIMNLLEAERILLEEEQAIIPLYQRGAIDLLNPAVRNLTVQIIGPRFQFKYVEIDKESR